MRKPKHHFNLTFRMNFYYCLGWSEKEIRKYMLEMWDYEDLNWGGGKTILHRSKKADIVFIWTKEKRVADFVHECVHAGNMTLMARGQDVDTRNDEVLAYLIEEIFSRGKMNK